MFFGLVINAPMARALNPAFDERKEKNGGYKPIVREDDGRLDNPRNTNPHVPTDESREKVKDLSRVCTIGQIATLMRMSESSLHRHYEQEMADGHAQAMAAIGTKMVEKALGGHYPSMAFTLARRGGWNEKITLRAPGGLIRNYDLSGKTAEELEQVLPLLDELIAKGEATEIDVSDDP